MSDFEITMCTGGPPQLAEDELCAELTYKNIQWASVFPTTSGSIEVEFYQLGEKFLSLNFDEAMKALQKARDYYNHPKTYPKETSESVS